MEHNLIMCRSLTYAQRALRTLERAGVSAVLLKVPQAISHTGCSYGLRVSARYLGVCLRLLNENHNPYGKVFRYETDGTLTEVDI